jgi:multicomponent Na+:H+ antiporter subunit D
MDGLGRKMPVTFTCFTISALSLSGIPPLCGFVSKWRLLAAATEEAGTAAWIGAGMLLCSAFLCTIYALSICVRAFFPVNRRGEKAVTGNEVREADRRMLLPICAFTAAVVLFGIWQTPVMDWLSGIANGLY